MSFAMRVLVMTSILCVISSVTKAEAIIMPDKRPLICCPPNEGVKVFSKQLKKTFFYCQLFVGLKAEKNGNLHIFDSASQLVREEVYQQGVLKKGVKVKEGCLDSSGKGVARTRGQGMKGLEMKNFKPGPRRSKPKSKVALGSSYKVNQGLLDNERDNDDSTSDRVQDRKENKQVEPSGIEELCPVTAKMNNEVLKLISSHEPLEHFCEIKNQAAKTFMQKLSLVESKVAEIGGRLRPCYKTLLLLSSISYKDMWFNLERRYCVAQSNKSCKIEWRSKYDVENVLKWAPYDPIKCSPVEPFAKKYKEIDKRNSAKLLALDKKIRKIIDVKGPIFFKVKKIQQGMDRTVKNLPEVKALTNKILRSMP